MGKSLQSGRLVSNSRIFVNSSGSIGIGTDNPSGTLDISAAASTDMLMFKNGATNFARIGYNSASGTAILDVRSEGHTRFLTSGNNESLRITSAGNFGIGDTNPDFNLVVKSSTNTNANILAVKDSDGIKMVSVEQDSNGNGRLFVRDTSGNPDVLLHTNGNSYFNGGSVGIGSEIPSTKLDILRSGSGVAARFGKDSIFGELQVDGQRIGIQGTRSSDSAITGFFVENPASTGTSNFELVTIKTAGTERLRIKSNGVVQIGDAGLGSDNGDRKLDIIGSGNGQAGLLIANNATSASGTCDISFAPSNKVTGAQIICEAQEDFSSSANRTADLTFQTRKDGTLSEKLRITSAGQLQATGAADVRLTLGSGGTAGTNDSVHIRADGANLLFMNASGGLTKFEANGTETLRISSSVVSITDQLTIGSGSSANSNYGLIAYANTNTTSNKSSVYARNIGGGRNFTGDNSAGATTFEVYSSGSIVSTQSSSSEITSYNTINSGSGNNKILIRTQANQGGDPYIKFDAGGSNMIVGTQYNGTTNNKLVLGEGENPSDVDGLHIAGNGNGTFTASLSTGNEVYINGTDASTQRYLNFVRPTSGQYRATLRRDAWYLGETVTNIGNTTPSGANITLKMNGDATFAGNCLFGTTSNGTTVKGICLRSTGELLASRSNGPALLVNRLGNDGTLVDFRGQNSSEGSISVSGSTVSYNGAHLSRWSQLSNGADRIEILRGSVLSNLDEMCEWAYESQDEVLYSEEDELPEGVSVGDVKTPARAAGKEDNEQLNRMKVSDVEGDKNVSGVFQSWDDDDDTYTNDFYCAMTGDFVIRIAQETTVARGDLLMSAGDGTAKPQDDDIVRSKTIAKVTSTTVSETHADGSYCVPCVLMAC